MLVDKKFRAPRIWSNLELEKFSTSFHGSVINVSGWKDYDKVKRRYSDYFLNSSEYWISNYKSEARGFQGNLQNEIFLDLEGDIDESLHNKFNVVFNHTVLEHIFNIDKAFENLCKLSNDIVIIIVPFLQEQHADYGDYWRFTPLAVKKLFSKNHMKLIYLNYNDVGDESIYILAIGSKHPTNWSNIEMNKDNKISKIYSHMIGEKHIKNSFITEIFIKIKNRWFK